MDITRDIQALKHFRRKLAEAVKHLETPRQPLLLTINGEAEVVVQDARAYQRLLDIAAQFDSAEGTRQDFEDLSRGRTRPARQVFDEVRREYGTPR